MKRKSLNYRELLLEILPIGRLSEDDRKAVHQAVLAGNEIELERIAFFVVGKLQMLGILRLVSAHEEDGEKSFKYRNLLTSDSIVLRHASAAQEHGVLKIAKPLVSAVKTSVELVRRMLSVSDRIITDDDRLLTRSTEVLQLILHATKEILACDHVAFYPVSKGTGESDIGAIATQEPFDPEISAEWVIKRDYLIYYPDIAESDLAKADSQMAGYRSLAMIKVGLESNGFAGVLEAWSKEARFFDEEKLALLSLVSDYSSSLLESTSKLQEFVFIDSLTGVYNRNFFNIQLDNEIARAQRENNAMAVCIADIDNFKQFNSSYGYEGANLVLGGIAKLLKRDLRPFDLIARWGGEEFALLLAPPLTLEDAKAICERLRKAVESEVFLVTGLDAASYKCKVTISIGGAMFPADAGTHDKLWRIANRALIEAKSVAEKNTVRFHEGS
ncbi:MAG: GGDEF domain-containing protein [Candidatus Eisenbacteria bacterium]|nr:GGDEF domain-containing protein [Candidatus Eisenbacteria bacterium]